MKKIIVFGSINMDVVAFCDKHPKVGETILGQRVEFFPGGKGANQAVAAAKADGQAAIIGCVGADAFGQQMLEHLKSCNVDTSSVATLENTATGVALITVDHQGKNNIVVVPGANALAHFTGSVPEDSIALAQFETPLPEITAFFKAVVQNGGTTILNPSPWQDIPQDLLAVTHILVLNEHEYAQLNGKPVTDNPQEIITIVQDPARPISCCIVTLGANGAVVMERNTPPQHIPGHAVKAADTTGAGDCFTGWLAAELGKGLDIRSATSRANAAAALSVSRPGAGPSVPNRAEVDRFSANKIAGS